MRHFFFAFLYFFNLSLASQEFKGRVIQSNGESIPYATVYIHETKSGIVTNEQGNFQTILKPGLYTCEFRSMGFNSITKKIEIKTQNEYLEIKLNDKIILLNELVVKPSKQNPADIVMRKAIAYAPRHMYQLQSFTSENYLKGSVKIEKVPGLVKKLIGDKKIVSLIGKLLVLESKNLVNFHSPNKYTQKVLAYKSSIPKDIEPKGGMLIATSSIYQADFMGFISPLSTRAFNYYHFKLTDIFAYGSHTVNKIKVTPKLKSDKLFDGYIYILDNNWSVFSIDFTTMEMGSSTRYNINFQEIAPTVFLPITYDINAIINTMGVKGYGRFHSSIKYISINLNSKTAFLQELGKEEVIVQKKPSKSLSKIAVLSAKEHLNTKDAIKLARLMSIEAKPQELKDKEKSLEIKDEDLVKMEIDSMSSKRDSTYWEEIRNVPLLIEEAESFKYKDTLTASKNIKTTGNSLSINLGDTSKVSLISGGTIKLSKSSSLHFEGLLNGILKEYNFVDGAWFGQKVSMNINTSKTSKLIISPYAYYTSARNTLVWKLQNEYHYSPMNNGQFSINIGNTSENIQVNGTSRFFNSISSLVTGNNIIQFYQKKFIYIENEIDIANGLRIWSGAGFENRLSLSNTTDFNIIDNSPLPNYPNQANANLYSDNSATSAWLKLEYTPFKKYRIVNGKKKYAQSAFPTFSLKYKKAFSISNNTNEAQYNKINFEINQNIKLSEFDHLNYRITTGAYFNKRKTFAPDLQYFEINPLLVTEKSFDNSFNLLPNYFNSNSQWIETHINYTSKYLLLKRISFLQTKQFKELLHLHTLWNEKTKQPYSEIGYSIRFGFIGNIGVFGSYNGLKNLDTKIKISIPLLGVKVNKESNKQ